MDVNNKCMLQTPHLTVINVDSVHNAYRLAINTLDHSGINMLVRNSVNTKNLHNVNIVMQPKFSDAHQYGYFDKRVLCASRKLSNKYQNAEFAWYMTGSNNVECIAKYMPNWFNFSDDGVHVNSNYGYIWKTQVFGIMQKLKNDKYTRQASIAIYDKAMSQNVVTKDVQCTLSIDFKILRDSNNNDALHMTVFMRSNDVIYGLPIDMFCFGTLQELICNELRLQYPNLMLGTYTHIATSLHIYESKYSLLSTNDKNLDDIIILAKNKFESIKHSTTFSNFWIAEDQYIFNCIDYEHFNKYYDSNAMIFNSIYYDIIQYMSFLGLQNNNAFDINDVMSIFNAILDAGNSKFNNDIHLFNYVCDCLNVAGHSMTLATLTSTIVLSAEIALFKENYAKIGIFMSNHIIDNYAVMQSIHASA